jgi:hypothetical protein
MWHCSAQPQASIHAQVRDAFCAYPSARERIYAQI